MQFADLKKELNSFRFYELRDDSDDYFEVVIVKKDLEALNSKLVSIFGDPTWPPENKLPKEIKFIIDPHGGVMAGQTLYFKFMEDSPAFVMLWPWGDKEHITVKAGRK